MERTTVKDNDNDADNDTSKHGKVRATSIILVDELLQSSGTGKSVHAYQGSSFEGSKKRVLLFKEPQNFLNRLHYG